MSSELTEVVSRGIFTIEEDSTIENAANIMLEKGVSSLAVTVSGKLTGILTDRDFVKLKIRDDDPKTVEDIMTKNPITIDSTSTVKQANKIMEKYKFRHLIITVKGEPKGVLSLRDVLKIDPEALKEVRGEEHQLVVFYLGDEAFGVDIEQVREIIKMTDITQMPNAPEFVEGIINLRGQITTIMDLRKRLGIKVSEADVHTRIIVHEASGSTLGMIVDSVTEVIKLNGKDIDPPSEASTNAKYIKGVGKLGDRLLILLDINKVLSQEELAQIEKIKP